MPHYVDGFVLPVPKRNLKAYCRMSRRAGRIWREHGALEYRETIYEDPKETSFPKMLKTKPGETVVFSWIVYKSHAHRDRVLTKVMKDPRMGKMMAGGPMPFDVKRMLYGGFKTIVEV